MKNKIGLVLAYTGTNYGALLQAYATQHIIESMGFDTEIIDYKSRSKFEKVYLSLGYLKHYIKAKKDYSTIKSKNNQENVDVFVENREKRRQISKEFRHRRLHNIREICGIRSLKRIVCEYDAVIVGSDQKWVPGACYGWIDSLRFVPNTVRRISYATSLGVSEYPKYCWADSKKMWRRMDYLSVREKQGADIIRQICGDIDVKVVLDPTYLMTKKQWEDVIPSRQIIDKKYILCYFLGNDAESKKCVKRYAKARGLQLVTILSSESYTHIDSSFADVAISDATPEDFLNLIRGAEVVLTDSFHGLAFSVINNKQFYIFYRKRDDALQSRNSRIDNILSTWEIEDRLIQKNDIDWNIKDEVQIDYSKVNRLLVEKREESLCFLKNALSF